MHKNYINLINFVFKQKCYILDRRFQICEEWLNTSDLDKLKKKKNLHQGLKLINDQLSFLSELFLHLSIA